MATLIERIRSGFPNLNLVLVSIVVALALEKLIDHMIRLDDLWSLSGITVLIWLQAASMLVVALTFWLVGSYTILTLRWDIGLEDAAGPFFFLVVMNVAIALIGPHANPAFFYVFATGNGAGMLAFMWSLKRASRHPENQDVLRHSKYRRVYVLTAGTVLVSLMTAALLQNRLIGPSGAAAAMLAVLALSLAMVGAFSKAWWRAVKAAERSEI